MRPLSAKKCLETKRDICCWRSWFLKLYSLFFLICAVVVTEYMLIILWIHMHVGHVFFIRLSFFFLVCATILKGMISWPFNLAIWSLLKTFAKNIVPLINFLLNRCVELQLTEESSLPLVECGYAYLVINNIV